MRSNRVCAVATLGAALVAPVLSAGDLSAYRGFRFDMNLPAVAKQADLDPSEAKVLHQRPAMIQELSWQAQRFPGATHEADPVKDVQFRFHNGELFQIVVTYDRYRTEGLTAEDLVAAISEQYGSATAPEGEIVFPSLYQETVKVLARWEDSRYSLSLVRSSYQPTFGLVASSKRLEAVAEAAILEAQRLDRQEAPQREIERTQREEEGLRIRQEQARRVNKPGFRP